MLPYWTKIPKFCDSKTIHCQGIIISSIEIISFIEQIPLILFELPFRFLAQLTVVFARDPRARRKNTEIPVRGVRGVTFFLTWKRTITRSPDLIKTQMPRRGTYNTAG